MIQVFMGRILKAIGSILVIFLIFFGVPVLVYSSFQKFLGMVPPAQLIETAIYQEFHAFDRSVATSVNSGAFFPTLTSGPVKVLGLPLKVIAPARSCGIVPPPCQSRPIIGSWHFF